MPAALELLGGIASWTRLTGETSHSAVVRTVTSGAVVRVLPGVLALPDRADTPGGRSLAALVFAGAPAALSHTTALDLHGLPVPAEVLRAAVHVSVPHHRRRTVPTGSSWRVELHRCRSDPVRVLRGGLEVVTAARAVVDSWPLLTGSDQRAPALVAVRRRLVTPTGLDAALAARRHAGGGSGLRQLVARIRAGCRSELELWGYERVFTGPAFAGLHRQVEVRVDGRTSVLDCYDEAAALALELDGRAHHDSPLDRERDVERDGRLAKVGVQTVRSSHRRLTREPEACRLEALAVTEQRRSQLARAELPVVVEVPGGGDEGARLVLRLPR